MPGRIDTEIFDHPANACVAGNHNATCDGIQQPWAEICARPSGALLFECHHIDQIPPGGGGGGAGGPEGDDTGVLERFILLENLGE